MPSAIRDQNYHINPPKLATTVDIAWVRSHIDHQGDTATMKLHHSAEHCDFIGYLDVTIKCHHEHRSTRLGVQKYVVDATPHARARTHAPTHTKVYIGLFPFKNTGSALAINNQ